MHHMIYSKTSYQDSQCKSCLTILKFNEVHVVVRGFNPNIAGNAAQTRGWSIRFCPKLSCLLKKLSVHINAKVPYFYINTPLSVDRGMLSVLEKTAFEAEGISLLDL